MPAPDVRRRYLLPALSALAALVLACSDASSGPGEANPGISGPLVGTWTGHVNGTLGAGSLTMPLNADSTMSLTSDNEHYCRMDGTWTVAGAVFTASGRDCAGLLITLTGSGTRNVRLTGTWTRSNGMTGSFDVTRD